MSEKSKIEWTEHTFNPWWGCSKVSPGCDHCYAERDSGRFTPGRVLWGVDAERRTFGDKHWNEPKRWDAAAAKAGKRARVFCASMGDFADKNSPAGARERLWTLIPETRNLDWLLLTKRVGNVAKMVPADWLAGAWPSNAWLGISVVNQEEADRDIPKLLALPAGVRFLSVEPMLGPIDLERPRPGPDLDQGGGRMICQPWLIQSGIHWVIVGGESGPKARPMHPAWARSLRDQCEAAGVPFLFKQWGEWTPGENVERQRGTVDTAYLMYDGSWHIQPLNLATDGGHVDDEPDLYRVGKKAAGRLLDGREWNGVPR